MGRQVFIFCFVLLNCFPLYSQKTHRFELEGNFGFGRLMAHRTNMQRLVINNSLQGEFTFNINTNGEKEFHEAFLWPTYGLTFNINNSGNSADIGNIYGTYGFVSLPITRNNYPLEFKIGLGIGWVENTFDLQNNFQSLAIGSHINANVVLRFEKEFCIYKNQVMNIGIGLNHVSNAAFKTPNLGLNFIALHVGYQLGIENQIKDSIDNSISYNKGMHFTIYNSSAFKENSTPLMNKFYINETTLQYGYRKGIKSSFITGTDIIINPSLLEFTDKKWQVGCFAGHLLHLDKLKIGFLLGTYLYNKKDNSEFLYQKIFTEYDLNDKLTARLVLKSHFAKADFFSLGIGYKIF